MGEVIYGLRNGEYLAPTGVGDWGFKGRIDVGSIHQAEFRGILNIVQWDSGTLAINMTTGIQKYPDHQVLVEECSGQWWGPVDGPWAWEDEE